MRTVEVKFGEGAVPVDGYATGAFRLRTGVVEGPLAILPGGPAAWPGLPDLELFIEAAATFDVLLVGVGPEIVVPDEAFRRARARLEAAGAGVETMITPSACRTYNVLLAEGRRVALAAMPV